MCPPVRTVTDSTPGGRTSRKDRQRSNRGDREGRVSCAVAQKMNVADRCTCAAGIATPLSALRAVDGGEQRRLRRVRRDEQILWQPGDIAQHVRVDYVGLVQVEPKAGEVLQAKILVAVQRRIAQPRF